MYVVDEFRLVAIIFTVSRGLGLWASLHGTNSPERVSSCALGPALLIVLLVFA